MYPSNPAEQVKHTIENRDALSLDSSQEIRTAFYLGWYRNYRRDAWPRYLESVCLGAI